MTAWSELRAACMVGTARRPIEPTEVAGVDLAAPGATAEWRILAAAALLGVERRAGRRADEGAAAVPEPAGPELLDDAPVAAVQLLELLLAGNLGRPTDVGPLLRHWFRTCAAQDRRVPHDQLVAVLDHAVSATGNPEDVAPVIGVRGRWLADQRDDWRAAMSTPDLDDGPTDLSGLTGSERLAVLRALRAVRPDAARELIEAAWVTDSAAERADALETVAIGLSPADEDLLERALDDRAKSVRWTAVRVLQRLPTSRRGQRLAAALAPLIDVRAGRLRPRCAVAALPDDVDIERDAPATPDGPPRLRRLIASAPLGVWHEVTGLEPEDLLRLPPDPVELHQLWQNAAISQADARWLDALARRTANPLVLGAIEGPWSLDLSRAVVARIGASPQAAHALQGAADVVSERLHPDALPDVDRLRASLGDVPPLTVRAIRRIVQLVTTRSSITEAFT